MPRPRSKAATAEISRVAGLRPKGRVCIGTPCPRTKSLEASETGGRWERGGTRPINLWTRPNRPVSTWAGSQPVFPSGSALAGWTGWCPLGLGSSVIFPSAWELKIRGRGTDGADLKPVLWPAFWGGRLFLRQCRLEIAAFPPCRSSEGAAR